MTSSLTREDLAASAAVPVEIVDRYTEAGVLAPDEQQRYRDGDVARIRLARSCERGGIPLDGLAKAIAEGALSFDFLDLPQYRWAAHADHTYADVASELGLDFGFIAGVHEAMGLERPSMDDAVRDDDLELLRALSMAAGVTGTEPIVRVARVYGEALRRIAEAEKTWYREWIELPFLHSGMSRAETMNAASEFGAGYFEMMDRALLHMYHRQQERAWLDNLVQDTEDALEELGVYEPPARPPAMCFLDLAGYTRLTEEAATQRRPSSRVSSPGSSR
jgi:hypothetical protein